MEGNDEEIFFDSCSFFEPENAPVSSTSESIPTNTISRRCGRGSDISVTTQTEDPTIVFVQCEGCELRHAFMELKKISTNNVNN